MSTGSGCDWRRGLGLEQKTVVTRDDIEEAHNRLSKEANKLEGTQHYGMHVALSTFLALARAEVPE
jgi:hypothetical protein